MLKYFICNYKTQFPQHDSAMSSQNELQAANDARRCVTLAY